MTSGVTCAATSDIRPDWDLSTPGLRDAWDAGDRSHFHGMGQAVRPALSEIRHEAAAQR